MAHKGQHGPADAEHTHRPSDIVYAHLSGSTLRCRLYIDQLATAEALLKELSCWTIARKNSGPFWYNSRRGRFFFLPDRQADAALTAVRYSP
jgi:hypothetical protein